MTGRMPTVVRRSLCLVGLVVCGSALLMQGGPSSRALGQEKLPKLPATKVEAEPTPGQPQTTPPADQSQPNPNDFPPPSPGAGNVPISGGGVFASPAVTGYNATSSTTGTIVNVPNLSFPGIVSVVPSGLISDQQAIRMDDILRDIPSAIKGFDTSALRPDAFIIRGFVLQSRDYRWNGFQDFSPAPRELANVQRVEVLQGPASVLYGAGQPSGLVNFITKKPVDDTFAYGDIQGGNFGLIRTTADVNGAVDSPFFGGTWLVRFNFAYLNTDSFRDFGFQERTLLNPVITYLFDDCNALTMEFQYLNARQRFDNGVVALGGTPVTNPAALAAGVPGLVGGNPALVPIQTFLGQPNDFARFNDYKSSATFYHKFNDDWSARVGGFAGWHDSPFSTTSPLVLGNDGSLAAFNNPLIPPPPFGPGPLTFSPTTLLRQVEDVPDFREQNYDIIANIAGKFNTGSVKHNLVLGYEFDYFHSNFNGNLSDPITLGTFPFIPFPLPVAASSPIDVLNPNYNVPTPPLPGSVAATITQARDGVYAQDLIELNKKWKLLAGVRYDVLFESFHENLFSPFAGFPIAAKVDESLHSYYWSPRVGVVYQPVEDVLSLYGSYSLSFDPATTGVFLPGTQIKNETGRDVEGGFKADLLDKHLSITASGFYIVKDNVITQINNLFSEQIGRQRSQGAEVSMTGKLTDRWSIIANYAYVDSRILNSGLPAQEGNRFRNVPFNNANLWTRYNLLQDCQQTFGVALGTVYVGERPGDLANSFSLPGYTRWDGGVFYQRGALNANLYLENIFDRNYYAGSFNNVQILPGNPFTLRAQVGVRF